MKRIVSAVLIMTLCGALWGCGSKEEEEQADSLQALSEFSSFSERMPEFETIDLEGNTVTNEIFSQADLTVVNFWATYCSPCIDEMPDLQAWSEEMPENVQIIGILVDVASADAEEYELARQIVEKTGVTFTNLAVTDGMRGITDELIGVPTTFFVDKEGNFVGEEIVGTDVEGYKQFVEEYLDGQE